MSMTGAIHPFTGQLTSTAFHVRDPEAFELDERIVAIRTELDVLVGQMPGDDTPCYCLAKNTPPRAPFFLKRQPGEAVISEGGDWDPEYQDESGWLCALQMHVREDDAIMITERANPGAPASELMWVVTADRLRCVERAIVHQ